MNDSDDSKRLEGHDERTAMAVVAFIAIAAALAVVMFLVAA